MSALLSLFRSLAVVSVASTAVWSTDFSFFTTLQAGLPSTLSWEIGAGSSGAVSESRTNYEWDSSAAIPHWRNNDLPQNFQIGYNKATNTGFATVFTSSNSAITSSFTNSGTALLPNATWTLPVANFFASATSFFSPASINVEAMSFSTGVQILSGSLPTSIGASYSGFGAPVMNNLAAPIIFNASNSGGSWTLSGSIRFNGLLPLSGSAFSNQMQFGVGAFGTSNDSQTPESSSALLIGCGLIALRCITGRRKS